MKKHVALKSANITASNHLKRNTHKAALFIYRGSAYENDNIFLISNV